MTAPTLLAECMPTRTVNDDVLAAAEYALTKHGPPATDPQRMLIILLEELGECATESNKLTSSNPAEWEGLTREERLARLRKELCQLSGYAMLQVQNIDLGRLAREGYGEEPQP